MSWPVSRPHIGMSVRGRTDEARASRSEEGARDDQAARLPLTCRVPVWSTR